MGTDLIPCRVCGNPVSEYAPTCPKCGDAVARRFGNEPRAKTGPWTIIGWVIVILLAIPLATCVGIIGDVAK